MKVARFVEFLGSDFYTGVPDSLLKPLYDFLLQRYGRDSKHHIIAANEGNCAALAAGYHLSTGKFPVVYLQNSGEGNIINPLASLLSEEVYGIPAIFIIGWRGEPGIHDEPQHILQGKVTLGLLETLGVPYFVLEKTTEEKQVQEALEDFRRFLSQGKAVAFVVRKGALTHEEKVIYSNGYSLKREEILRAILSASGDDSIICTTGKASRELFELREARGEDHGRDFLTVGSMGHSSSIALGIALQRPDRRIWCIDGDGAALMHMGAMAVMGNAHPKNLIHVLINNESHESVGGAPTVAGSVDFTAVALACGYGHAEAVSTATDLEKALLEIKQREELCLLEVKCAIGARKDLGRPTTTPKENKISFIERLGRVD